MRTLFLLFGLAFGAVARANVIDGLQTRQDVERFLARKAGREFKGETIFGSRPGRDSTDMPGWFYKVDLDGDGLTDLVVNGLKFVVVMDRGDKGFWARTLGQQDLMDGGLRLLAIDSVGAWKGLEVWNMVHKRRDTLVYHLGSFIEYNAHPLEHLDLVSLHFSAGGCYGTCPIFELQITGDGHITYHAERFNPIKGEFRGVIPEADLAWIKQLLTYLPLDRLDSSYAVQWTDDATVWLEMRYNGRVKRISDYGCQGTLGLSWLYGLLFALRDKVEWENS